MPIMTKMRDNMPAILVGLAILFVAMIVFEWGMDITGRKDMQYQGNVVGKVNGEEINYQDFEKTVQSAIDNYRATNKKDPSDQVTAEIRDQVWQELVNQILVSQAAKRLGIVVTNQEIVNWVTQNPQTLPDVIKRNFEDSTGHLNMQILHAALASNRPEVQRFWSSVQEYLKEQSLQNKLTSRLYSAVRISEGELRYRYAEEHQKLDAGYVVFPPQSLFPDTTIHITESEMRDYYSAHENDYRTQPTRALKYVVFPITASAQDSSEVEQEINRVATLAAGGTNFLDLVSQYSDTPYNDKFENPQQIDPAIVSQVLSAKVGAVIGPFLASDGYHLIKLVAERNSKNEFVHAAHILIRVNPGPDSISSYRLADSILKQARSGVSFAELARKYSQDPGSASRGGDLGWFGKGMMVEPFEKAAFSARVGQIVGPVRTQFGLHIIKVLGKDSKEVKIADVKMGIKPSSQTREDLKQHAEDFIYVAKQSGFNQAAFTVRVKVRQTPSFRKGPFIPGVGNYENVANWAFSGKLGDLSDVTRIGEGYAVFMISQIKDAAVTPFKDVAAQIKNLLVRKKQFDKAQAYADQLRKKLSKNDSLAVLAQSNSKLHYTVTGPFYFGTYVPGIGRDYMFMAEASKLQVGQISSAIKGNSAVYLIQLLSKTPFDSTAFKIQRMTMVQQLMQQEKSSIVSEWLQHLKKTASIVDNRSKIFGNSQQ